MKRDLWATAFAETAIPNFPCPQCATGVLRLIKEGLREEGPPESNMEPWELNWRSSRFTAFLRCTQSECGEYVAVSGGFEVYEEYIEEGHAWGPGRLLRPELFFPAPPIITIPVNTPNAIKMPLLKSFQLFWVDPASSANKIRSSLEALLTKFRVPRYTKRKGKRRQRLTLHDRIKHYELKLSKTQKGTGSPAVEKLLNALRFVGNVGSHQEVLERDVLLDAFEIYEHILEELIGKRPEAIQALAAALIASRGRRSKKA